MMKIDKKSIIIILLLIVCGYLFFRMVSNSDRAGDYNRRLAEATKFNNKLQLHGQRIGTKYAEAVRNNTELTNRLTTKDKELHRLIKNNKEKVKEIENLKLSFRPAEATFETESMLDAFGCKVKIDTTLGKVKLTGETICNVEGAKVSLAAEIGPLRFSLARTLTKDKLYKYYLIIPSEDSNFVTIDSLDVQFVPDKPTFLQKHALKIGVIAGVLTVILLK